MKAYLFKAAIKCLMEWLLLQKIGHPAPLIAETTPCVGLLWGQSPFYCIPVALFEGLDFLSQCVSLCLYSLILFPIVNSLRSLGRIQLWRCSEWGVLLKNSAGKSNRMKDTEKSSLTHSRGFCWRNTKRTCWHCKCVSYSFPCKLNTNIWDMINMNYTYKVSDRLDFSTQKKFAMTFKLSPDSIHAAQPSSYRDGIH